MADATADRMRSWDGLPQQLLFGLYIDALTLEQVVERCAQHLASGRQLILGVVNAAKIVHLRSDRVLRESLLDCDLLLADGQSVVWASRLLRRPLPERVAGIDLFVSLLELADRDHRSVFLLGARADVLAALTAKIAVRYPGLRIAGACDGYFADAQADGIAAQIRASGADMLFLGMVSPKKEVFLGSHGPTLGVGILHGVGGSFDVLAGVTERAPVRWQRLGLEWAFRLRQEPGRLWRRYLSTNTAFILFTLGEAARPKREYKSRSPLPINDPRRFDE